MNREEDLDLEAIEFFVRSHMLKAGARVLEQLLAPVGRGRRSEPMLCAENHIAAPMRSRGIERKAIRTICGPISFERSVYACDVCGQTRYPGDEEVGVVKTGFSPGARRMMSRAGAKESFAGSAEDLRVYADLDVGAKDVERVAEQTGRVVEGWMAREATKARLAPPDKEEIETFYVSFDGTGIPMRSDEVAGVRGKGPDGKAKTREAKLGGLFTQAGVDEKGRPRRDEASTSYVGAIETSSDFGHRIHAEAMRRGMAGAKRVVVLTDGAGYNKTIVAEHFPGAIHILDLYHAREHLSDFSKDDCRLPLDSPSHLECRSLLDEGKILELTEKMHCMLPRSGPRRKTGLVQINYFRQNAYAMRYAEFRGMGLFVGSGVIEAGCKTVIGERLKRSGMFWSQTGANAIIALRCCFASGRFEQFWEDTA